MKVFPAALLLCLCACEPMVTHRGHVEQSTMLDTLKIGTHKEDVMRRFGSPSSRSAFGDETWYYIQARKEATAFFKPEITEQVVVGVIFDRDGNVLEVTDFDLADRQQVVMVDDVTPTEGHSIGFFEQVLGNLGRFNNTGTRQPNPRGPVGRR